MEIKDFKKGDTVYVLSQNRGKSVISESTVKKVGSKYVTIDNSWETRYQKETFSDNDNFLYEVTEYGERSYLFVSKKEAEEYVEAEQLELFLRSQNWNRANKYSLAQLRAVKAILEPDTTTMPETCGIMTLSTAHITPETADLLDSGEKIQGVVTYPKNDYGWFIFVGSFEDYENFDEDEDVYKFPSDLRACVKLALGYGCDWLCLDADGNETDKLPIYQWNTY